MLRERQDNADTTAVASKRSFALSLSVLPSSNLYKTPRTPYLVEDELKGDSLRALYCRLTTVANQRVFGTDLANENRSPNFIQARRQAAKRRVPVIHVYVISTTSVKREQSLCFMFQQLPVRIWRLQRSDFVHDSYLQGAYETLGLDRIAAVRAAAYLYGTPTLVIDGGTALTYTALDRKGAFAGGGILAGVNMRLQGLHEKTSQLPYINPAEFRGLVEARLNKTSAPFDRYAVHDTKEAIVAGILYDITDSLLGIIQPWRKKCLSEMDESTQKNNQSVTQIKENKNRVIVLAGGDAELFQKLLAPNHSGIINLIWGAKALEKWTIVNHRNVSALPQVSNAFWRCPRCSHSIFLLDFLARFSCSAHSICVT